MRPLPFFLAALLLLNGCGLITIRKPPVIPARDLSRLAVVAEALLRDDGFTSVDKYEARDGFGEDATRGLRLSASKDNADVFKAAKKGGWGGALSNLFLNDKSSADAESSVEVELYPRPGGHEVRVRASARRQDSKGAWKDEQAPYGYDQDAFAQRLMRAYGAADSARPVSWPASRPLPLKDPALSPQKPAASKAVPAGLKAALQPAPSPTPRTKKSSMLFGPQPTEEP